MERGISRQLYIILKTFLQDKGVINSVFSLSCIQLAHVHSQAKPFLYSDQHIHINVWLW